MGRRGRKPSVEIEEIVECYQSFLQDTPNDIFDEEGNLMKERNKVWGFFSDQLGKRIEIGNLYRRILENRSGIQDTLLFLKFDHVPEKEVDEDSDVDTSTETIASDDRDEKIEGN